MSEHEAGRELDALIAERVFGWDGRTLVRKNAQSDYQIAYRHAPGERSMVYDRYFTADGEKLYCGQPWSPHFAPAYSTDIAAAWQIVEKLRDGFQLDSLGFAGEEWRCMIARDVDLRRDFVVGEASTAPLAICRAALAALDAEARRA